MTMSIGIIGAGNIGQAFAHTLARAGVKATISNSRGPNSLKDLARSLAPSIIAGTREQAASADVVFIAVNWTRLSSALAVGARLVQFPGGPLAVHNMVKLD
jgi:8-hydroxy-5-deazaflavin:NADPH oxidoreductase